MYAYEELDKQLLEALQKECREAPVPEQVTEDISMVCGHQTLRLELIDLMQEFHHQPARQLEGMIRRRLMEMQFVDENGDRVLESPQEQKVELEVKVLVGALEKMRQRALERGLWGQAQASVPCCG